MASPIAERIAALQDIQNTIREFRQKAKRIPDIDREIFAQELRLLADEFARPSKTSTIFASTLPVINDDSDDPDGTDDEEPLSGADRMIAFFVHRNNLPATVEEICSVCGVSQHNARSVLYKRNRGRFVKDMEATGSSPSILWKLSTWPVGTPGERRTDD